jgi:hypothetical protein
MREVDADLEAAMMRDVFRPGAFDDATPLYSTQPATLTMKDIADAVEKIRAAHREFRNPPLFGIPVETRPWMPRDQVWLMQRGLLLATFKMPSKDMRLRARIKRAWRELTGK